MCSAINFTSRSTAPSSCTSAVPSAGRTSWPEFPFTYGGVDNEHPDRFPAMDATAADAKRGRTAANMYWELGPDDALPPDIKRINAFECSAQMWERFNGVRGRFPL